jgi:hypothetical protein
MDLSSPVMPQTWREQAVGFNPSHRLVTQNHDQSNRMTLRHYWDGLSHPRFFNAHVLMAEALVLDF